MRIRRWIFWMSAVLLAWAPLSRAQLPDEILFPIEYAILPELVPSPGTAIALPRTVGSTRVFIDLRNTSDRPYEGTLSLQISVKAGPWVLGPPVPPAGFTCQGGDKQQTCSRPNFILRQGEEIRIIQPITCLIFSTELTRIELSGPEVPTEEFTIAQHNSPFAVVAGYDDLIMEQNRARFREILAMSLVGQGFTGRTNTLTSLSGGSETSIGPPSGTLLGGAPPCPPAGVLICPGGPITFAPNQVYTYQTPVETTVGTTTPRVTFAGSFPDNAGVAGFNVSHPVEVPLAGPDPTPTFVCSRLQLDDSVGGFCLLQAGVRNVGSRKTEGPVVARVVLSAGLSSVKGQTSEMVFPGPIAPGSSEFEPYTNIYFREPGLQSVQVTMSGGGDVRTTNNTNLISLDIAAFQPDSLERAGEELARILEGR